MTISYFRDHPNVVELDMLHAQDYSQLNIPQLFAKMKDKKQQDWKIGTNIL